MRRSSVLIAALAFICASCSPSTPPVDAAKLAQEVGVIADTYVRSYLDAFPYQALVIGAPRGASAACWSITACPR